MLVAVDQAIKNMLHLLVGPSGAGKTSVIDILRRNYGWYLVETFTTRPLRPTDVNKIYINPSSFGEMKEQGLFFATQHVYQTSYGQSKKAIREASINDNRHWIFDLSLNFIDPYLAVCQNIFVLLPESEHQLVDQLVKAGRKSRIEESVQDYRNLIFSIRSSKISRLIIVYNAPDNMISVVQFINAFAMRL